MSNLSDSQLANPSMVIGIGASHGGLEAIQSILRQLSNDASFAVVIVQHLHDDSEQVLLDVLRRGSKLPVSFIAGPTAIQGGHVYVAQARGRVYLQDRMLRSSELPGSTRLGPIDHFFSSLADLKEKAVGVILSGNGSDGALGLKKISDAGGMTVIQSPDSAKAPSMPEAAAALGIVDYVLPPEEIAFELMRHGEQALEVDDEDHPSDMTRQIIAAIPEIAAAIEKQTDNDFKHYKTTTLTRRIRRRIQVLKIQSVDAYIELLNSSRDEAIRLFRELLISVTEFFRDSDAFHALTTDVISKQLSERKSLEPFRVWVAGCATGEEAYSIAMLLLETVEALDEPIPIQIFATDLDDRALEIARAGSYPIGIQDNLTPERLRKHFTKRSNRYFVNKSVRDLVVFSTHNLISDPPFTKQDLIICRNLLIYLGSHLQKKLIPLFHYSLRRGGHLFLGPSETMSGHQELFLPINAKHRIYQRKSTAIGRPSMGDLPQINYPRFSSESGEQNVEVDLYQIGQRISLDEFSPQWAIVDDNFQIYALSSDPSDFLQFSAGTFKNNIVSLARSGLKIGLRATFSEAKKTRRRVVTENLSVPVDGGIQRVNLTVQPMPEVGQEASLHYVAFQKLGEPMRLEDAELRGQPDAFDPMSYDKARSLIEQLESELAATRSDLERTVQELEAANEELKSSNEELLTMNEELQSANEELETSKQDLLEANETLAHSNSDLENLLASTSIATIFVDKNNCIRNFTPAAKIVYSLIESDIGRPLEDLRHKATTMPAVPSVDDLVNERAPAEDSIRLEDGRWFIRRLHPYRSRNQTSEGLVMTFTDVSELRTGQQRLEMALNAGSLGAWDLDKKTNTAWRSPCHDVIFGYAEMLPEWTFEMFMAHSHPDDASALASFFEWAETQEEWSYETRIKRVDGETRWIIIRARSVLDESGHAVQMFGTVADITDRKRDAERIKDSEAHLRRIIDNMATFLCVLDTSGTVLEANRAALEAGAMTREQVLGKPFWECDWWSYDDSVVNQLKEAVARARVGELVRYDVKIRVDGDKDLIIDFMLAPVLDDHGTVTHLIPSGIDITDRNEFLLAVEASEERFRTLADNIAQFAWMAEANGDISWYNKRWFEYTGTTLDEMSGWGWSSVHHPDHVERVVAKAKRAFAEQIEWEDTYPIRRHDGEYRWFLSRMIPIVDQSGHVVRWFGTNTDITDQKNNEMELVKARSLAEAANQAKTDFLANMSHEIRSPMTAILGFADLLNVDNEADREKVDTIRKNGQFLLQLVNDILDLSKIEAGKVTVDAVRFDPTLLLEDVCSLMSVRAVESGLNLKVEYEDALPIAMTSDPIRLRQVLINLVGNAIKFTEDGDVILKLRYQETDKLLRFDIIDTGIGMTEAQQKKLFRPFEQADASIVRKYGGSGLGLAISERLAELLGGHIEVRSKVGEGSTFSLVIACDDDTEVADAAARASLMLGGPSLFDSSRPVVIRDGQIGSGRLQRRVLIVDDRRDIRFLTQHFVQQLGGDVLLAENGVAALELIDTEIQASRDIDIILMDVQMPEMDGFTTVRTLRAQGFSQPIIALTANAMQSDRDACFAAGYTDYLSKPIDIQKLTEALRKYGGC